MSDICPMNEKCPIYGGVLKGKEKISNLYRLNYCTKGAEGRNACKRWQVASKYGQCPQDILPNSMDSIEEIATHYQLKEK